MQLTSERLILKVPLATDTDKLAEYYKRNRNYLKKWFVDQPDTFYETETIQFNIENCQQKLLDHKEVKFFLYKIEKPEDLIGELNFSNIIRGGFLSCYTGYHIDEHQQGKGLMTEALKTGIEYVFGQMHLHRIEANIMPANIASQRVAAKAGFHQEGISPRYLRINGRWEDHLRYVIFNPMLE